MKTKATTKQFRVHSYYNFSTLSPSMVVNKASTLVVSSISVCWRNFALFILHYFAIIILDSVQLFSSPSLLPASTLTKIHDVKNCCFGCCCNEFSREKFFSIWMLKKGNKTAFNLAVGSSGSSSSSSRVTPLLNFSLLLSSLRLKSSSWSCN